MDVIVCVDDRMGMLFNHRRQSQDGALRTWILNNYPERKLWLNSYSARQFEENYRDRLEIREDFLNCAGEKDLCFVEDRPLKPVESRIRRLILCRWNRHYPSDTWLDLDLRSYRLQSSQEIPGSSHETILVEVYDHE